MAITEQQRHQLFTKLEELIGIEEATTLMEHLPPVGWADVATKSDLDHHQALTTVNLARFTAELRHEISEASAVLSSDITQLRTDLTGDITQLRTDLTGDITQLRTDLTGDITRVRTDLELTIERGFREQTHTMVLTNLGSMVALAGVLIAAVKI